MAVGDIDLDSLAMMEDGATSITAGGSHGFQEGDRVTIIAASGLAIEFTIDGIQESTGPHFYTGIAASSTGDLLIGLAPVRIGVALRRRVRELLL